MPAVRKASQSVKEEDVKPYSRASRSPSSSADVKPKVAKAAKTKSKAASGASARGNLPAGSKTQLARAVISAGLKALTNEEAAQISGLTVAQAKKQLEAGRGVRRALLEFADSLGP